MTDRSERPRVELLAPAGDFAVARAAFAAGADAVYCGMDDFSARAFAPNFDLETIGRLIGYARARGRKVYVAANTLVDDRELPDMAHRLAALAEMRPDGLIVQDLGVARLCRRHFPELPLHASTQLVAHNLAGVEALAECGFVRTVLARELTLEEIAAIAKCARGMEFECFVHGALCYSISGLCLFSALEKGRSGNRGRCAYCCRNAYPDEHGGESRLFSMKDLRLGRAALRLADAGVASLKIEGRMKSALYVASAVRYYRQILDGPDSKIQVDERDLETVFSRRTTTLYLDGWPAAESPVDPVFSGHLGTVVGVVKRVTRDRQNRAWVRFHTNRALERHDGLQFPAPAGGRPCGFGIGAMRLAISRSPVFEAPAGADVEVELPQLSGEAAASLAAAVRPGAEVRCAMSNAMRRAFPDVPCRTEDTPGSVAVDLSVRIEAKEISVDDGRVRVARAGDFAAAKSPERTFAAVEKAFSRFGGTPYRFGRLQLNDAGRLFAPPAELNELRREYVRRRREFDLSEIARREAEALADVSAPPAAAPQPRRVLRLRRDQQPPGGDWDEIVVVLDDWRFEPEVIGRFAKVAPVRLALLPFISELRMPQVRRMVKQALRAGHIAWEAADLAQLKLLRGLGVEDLTVDWTGYAANIQALDEWRERGARRLVCAPDADAEARGRLLANGRAVELLERQSTPLFISRTAPAALPSSESDLVVYPLGGLWITVAREPRVWRCPDGATVRTDISWDPPSEDAR